MTPEQAKMLPKQPAQKRTTSRERNQGGTVNADMGGLKDSIGCDEAGRVTRGAPAQALTQFFDLRKKRRKIAFLLHLYGFFAYLVGFGLGARSG